jgi:hypothetical protein
METALSATFFCMSNKSSNLNEWILWPHLSADAIDRFHKCAQENPPGNHTKSENIAQTQASGKKRSL